MSPSTKPKAQTPKSKNESPTDLKCRFLWEVIKNNKNKLDVDWGRVAHAMNLRNANVASTRYGQIKKELVQPHDAVVPDEDPNPASSAATSPALPTKKRKMEDPKAAETKPKRRRSNAILAKDGRVKTEDRLEKGLLKERMKRETDEDTFNGFSSDATLPEPTSLFEDGYYEDED